MSNHEYIYVAEAYNQHGERVERIAHTTHEGAVEDISVHAWAADEELITGISELRVKCESLEDVSRVVLVEAYNGKGQRTDYRAFVDRDEARKDSETIGSLTQEELVTNFRSEHLYRGSEATAENQQAVETNRGP